MPNAELLANPLVNHSTQGARRSEIEIRMETELAQHTLDRMVSITAGVPGVLSEPGPTAFVRSVEPNRVTLLIQFWHLPSDGLSVTSAVVNSLATDARHRDELVSVVAPPPAAPLAPPAPI